MKKSIVFLLHLGYWLLYGFLFTFLFFISRATAQAAFDDWDDWLVILSVAALTGLGSFYTFYGWLVPRYLSTRNVGKFIGWGLFVSIAVAGLVTSLVFLAVTALVSAALHTYTPVVPSVEDLLSFLGWFSLLAVVNGLLATIIRGFITWYADIHVKETLANRTLRTELALLKAQLNPHFLFNTLNNIDILIGHDAPRASAYLNKLSDLLRYVLYETQADRISLTKEWTSIETYVALQKIRTANAQYVTLNLEGQTEGVAIAPMLFIPYLENAFKYAANKKTPDAIRIRLKVDADTIHFQCINVIDKNRVSPDRVGGLGNELLQQRLALLYPDQHTLTVEATEEEYRVELDLPITRHELSAY